MNDSPTVSTSTVSLNTAEDTYAVINVLQLSGAADVDGDSLFLSDCNGAVRGSTSIELPGSVRYTPNANAAGSDAFACTVADGQGGGVAVSVAVTITGASTLGAASICSGCMR